MRQARRSPTGSATRAARHSRDLVIELKRIEAAPGMTQALASTAKPRVTPQSCDL